MSTSKATFTDELKLEKPDLDDFYDIGVMNKNMELIDQAIKKDRDDAKKIKETADKAVPDTRKINKKPLSEDVDLKPSDIGAVPNERKVNGKALSADIDLEPSDIGAVPETREINGKMLDKDIRLIPSDIDAATADHTHELDELIGIFTCGTFNEPVVNDYRNKTADQMETLTVNEIEGA